MAVTTKLVKDGNSMAVRLPKALLELSGLDGAVQLEASKGRIVIKPALRVARAGWQEQIQKVAGQAKLQADDNFADLQAAAADGLEALDPWNGPTYEEWLAQHWQYKHKRHDNGKAA